eukprot:gene8136-biopygen18103
MHIPDPVHAMWPSLGITLGSPSVSKCSGEEVSGRRGEHAKATICDRGEHPRSAERSLPATAESEDGGIPPPPTFCVSFNGSGRRGGGGRRGSAPKVGGTSHYPFCTLILNSSPYRVVTPRAADLTHRTQRSGARWRGRPRSPHCCHNRCQHRQHYNCSGGSSSSGTHLLDTYCCNICITLHFICLLRLLSYSRRLRRCFSVHRQVSGMQRLIALRLFSSLDSFLRPAFSSAQRTTAEIIPAISQEKRERGSALIAPERQ